MDKKQELKKIQDSCYALLASCEKQKYIGYGKFDALNSPLLKFFSFNQPFLRLAIIQSVMRFPLHIRPLFGVKKSGNPKGFGLFAMAMFDLYEAYGDQHMLEQAKYCLDWLLDNSTSGYSGRCWGYNFNWQNGSLFFAPFGFPNCVVTVTAGEALLRGYSITGDEKYLEAAKSTARFITNDLPVLVDEPERKSIAYVPIKGVGIVINVNALAAAFLSRLAKITKDEKMVEESLRLIRYVVSTQTDYGAWYYTDPPKKSYIQHDHYHTGFILDGILETMQNTGSDEFMPAYLKGLDFYLENLFMPDGAPKYMANREKPYDIHGSAQALITLANAIEFRPQAYQQAVKTAHWTIDRMQKKSGDFRYQIGKYKTRHFTLMRWCNAWMARGMASFLARTCKDENPQGK